MKSLVKLGLILLIIGVIIGSFDYLNFYEYARSITAFPSDLHQAYLDHNSSITLKYTANGSAVCIYYTNASYLKIVGIPSNALNSTMFIKPFSNSSIRIVSRSYTFVPSYSGNITIINTYSKPIIVNYKLEYLPSNDANFFHILIGSAVKIFIMGVLFLLSILLIIAGIVLAIVGHFRRK